MARLTGSKNNITVPSVEAAIGRLVGKPIIAQEDTPLSSEQRITALLQRIKQAEAPPVKNKFQSDFIHFLFEAVTTKDEARGGKVARIPPYDYLRELSDALVTCPLLLIEKSRRVLASWVACAFDVWLAAGGQDERWPALMNATEYRQVIVASRKLQDTQGSSWFLQNRIKFIVDQLEKNNIREKWSTFPKWEWTASEARCSNGSLISAVASGADNVRGAGATLIHAEEVAFWAEAQSTIESALPALLGGGHIVCITTPQANTYASRITAGTLKRNGGHYGNDTE